MRINSYLFLLVLLIFCQALQAQEGRRKTFKSISQSRTLPGDTIAIQIILSELRQSIQQQNPTTISRIFAKQFENEVEARTKDQIKSFFDNYFSSAQSRIAPKLSSNFTSTWDFDIAEPKIRFSGDRAYVDCNLVFHHSDIKTSETLTFIKYENSSWQLAGAKRLIWFLNMVLPSKTRYDLKGGKNE